MLLSSRLLRPRFSASRALTRAAARPSPRPVVQEMTIWFDGERVLKIDHQDEPAVGPLAELSGQHWQYVPDTLGVDADLLLPKLQDLIAEGVAFQIFAPCQGGPLCTISGVVSGLRTRLVIAQAHAGEIALQTTLEQGQKTAQKLRTLQAQLDSSPTALFATDENGAPQPLNGAAEAMVAQSARAAAIAKIFPVIEGGARQLFAPDGAPLGWVRLTLGTGPDGTQFVHIEDIDKLTRAEQALTGFMSTLTETFAHLDSALAIFDRDRQLSLFNPALADLFNLNPTDLALRPSFREFLEALRQARMLPEQTDYTKWRRSLSEAVENAGDAPFQEDWTLPSGQILRVTVRPHPHGAMAFVFKDISGHVMLERRYRAEIELGQATLDRLQEAVAVFGGAGQTLFTNAAFEQTTGYDAFETIGGGGIDELVAVVGKLCKPTEAWSQLVSYALQTDRLDRWSGIVEPLGGGRWLLRASALPDGSTMLVVTNTDRSAQEPDRLTSLDTALLERKAARPIQ